MQVAEFASLTWIIEDRVPLMPRLEQIGVLFCFIREKTCSSPALLCGITSTTLATLESSSTTVLQTH